MWSAPVKAALLAHNPKMKLLDSLGSSEGSGFARKLEGSAGSTSTARFELGPQPGCSPTRARRCPRLGRTRAPGHERAAATRATTTIPVRVAETFPGIDGVGTRSLATWATVEADGTIVLLGRGSVCINTGGEKVYPEEVEEALKLIDEVVDANVVGVPDERWGEAIVAVFELRPGRDRKRRLKSALETTSPATSCQSTGCPSQGARARTARADYRWARENRPGRAEPRRLP